MTIVIVSITLIIFAVIIFITKSYQDERVFATCDSYGSIQVFRDDDKLLAILYKDRTIDYQTWDLSFNQSYKIRVISDSFEKYSHRIIREGGSLCL